MGLSFDSFVGIMLSAYSFLGLLMIIINQYSSLFHTVKLRQMEEFPPLIIVLHRRGKM